MSLIEMVMAISLGTVLMGIMAGMLVALMHINDDSRANLGWQSQRARLADYFREDVHAAVDFEASTPEVATMTRTDGTVVEFRVDENRLIRRHHRADETLATETFPLPPLADVQFATTDQDRLASLQIRRINPTTDQPSSRAVVIEAVIGLDQRFTASEDTPPTKGGTSMRNEGRDEPREISDLPPPPEGGTPPSNEAPGEPPETPDLLIEEGSEALPTIVGSLATSATGSVGSLATSATGSVGSLATSATGSVGSLATSATGSVGSLATSATGSVGSLATSATEGED